MEWTAFRWEQTENIQILHRPRRSPFIEACAIANVMNFQPLVDFFNLPDLNIIQFCIFLPWIRLSNGVVRWVFIAKSLCFLYFPLGPVCHFKNSQRRACSLRGVSGRVHLETRKVFVALGKEFDMYLLVAWIQSLPSFSTIISLKKGKIRKDLTWQRRLYSTCGMNSMNLPLFSKNSLKNWKIEAKMAFGNFGYYPVFTWILRVYPVFLELIH